MKSFGSYVAEAVDVSISSDNKITVNKVYCVIDCGIAINPEIVKRQMQSAIIYGLTVALRGKIHFNKGGGCCRE